MTRLRRALASGNPLLAWAAAAELPRIELADALGLCLLLVDVDRPRYERALVRWHGRFCREAALSVVESHLTLVCLQGLGTSVESAAVAALAEVLEQHAMRKALTALEGWAEKRDGGS